jgi:HK97 family phage major capsid protein
LTLFGRPVIPIEQCQSVGTVGDILLCDFTNGYVLARKGQLKTDVSIHVEFLTDQLAFRFILRIDGQPILRTPITPAHGSNTLSHFVGLSSNRT